MGACNRPTHRQPPMAVQLAPPTPSLSFQTENAQRGSLGCGGSTMAVYSLSTSRRGSAAARKGLWRGYAGGWLVST
jgi:hypothetical protein